jgi:hypothetical protein
MGKFLNPKILIGGLSPTGQVFQSTAKSLSKHVADLVEIVTDVQHFNQDCFYLALDFNPSEYKKLLRRGLKKNHAAVIAFEPESAVPWQTTKRLNKYFDYVIPVGRPSRQNGEFWPQQLELRSPPPLRVLSDEICMLASNKISFSGDELYSLRRKTIVEIDNLRLYGNGWNQGLRPKLETYFRELSFFLYTSRSRPRRLNFDYLFLNRKANWVDSKRQALEGSAASLVIENSRSYSSEKLLDSITAFVPPIYVGPSDCLPQEILDLCFMAEPNVRSIEKAVERALNVDLPSWSSKVQSICSDPFIISQLSQESVFLRIASNVRAWAVSHCV